MMRRTFRLALAALAPLALLPRPSAAQPVQLPPVDSMMKRGSTIEFAFEYGTHVGAGTSAADSVIWYHLLIGTLQKNTAVLSTFTGKFVVLRNTATDSVVWNATGQMEIAALGPNPRRSAWVRLQAVDPTSLPARDIFDPNRRRGVQFIGSVHVRDSASSVAAGTAVFTADALPARAGQPIPLCGRGPVATPRTVRCGVAIPGTLVRHPVVTDTAQHAPSPGAAVDRDTLRADTTGAVHPGAAARASASPQSAAFAMLARRRSEPPALVRRELSRDLAAAAAGCPARTAGTPGRVEVCVDHVIIREEGGVERTGPPAEG